MFTKNCILNTQELLSLYDKYNSMDATIYRLKDSQSVFLVAGIVPFFTSKIYYETANLIKIYNNETLTYLKFDPNNTKDDKNNSIAVSQSVPPLFIVSYDSSGLFSYLQKIYDNSARTNPEVNSTMSKIDEIFYL
jgi:hypothetical protein